MNAAVRDLAQSQLGPALTDAMTILARLHRGQNAAIGFARKNPDRATEANPEGWEGIGTATPEALNRALLSVLSGNDTYATLNSIYFDPAKWQGNRQGCTGLPVTPRKIQNLSWLNAAWVDLDCYKAKITPDAAYRGAIGYFLEHGLPLPTLAFFSGRGLWLVFEFESPLKATPDHCSLLGRVNDNLVARLKHLGADTRSKDAARVCRVAGSINSGSGSLVEWHELHGGRRIDLKQFAAALEVPARKVALTKQEQRRPIFMRNPSRVARGYRRWQTRRCDILQVIEHRKTIPSDREWRYWFLFYLAAVSKAAGIPIREIKRECLNLGRFRCAPALPDAKIVAAVTGGIGSRYNITDATIIAQLGITQAEMKLLNLTLGKQKRAPRSRSKRSEIQDRRRLIAELVHDGVPSVRRMVEALNLKGMKVAREAVRKDYLALGITKQEAKSKSFARARSRGAWSQAGQSDHILAGSSSYLTTPAKKRSPLKKSVHAVKISPTDLENGSSVIFSKRSKQSAAQRTVRA